MYSPDPQNAPYKVLLSRGEFIDNTRQNEDGSVRVVPYKIYYPVDHDLDSLPIIIWSHGFGGNRDGAAFTSRYIAAQGYVVVHLTHHGTDSSLWEGKDGHPWDILRKTKVSRATTLNRMYDVPFALDSLHDWADENPETGNLLDWENIGMSGHSFGAMTTQVMAGMHFPDKDGALTSLKEPRFKAGILYSPVPIAHISDAAPADLYGPIDLPLLHHTGTDDDSPIENFGYEHRLVVMEKSNAAEKHLVVLQDGDHMVYNGTRGKLEKNPNRETHEQIINVSSLAFWDWYLKGNESARIWLEDGGLTDYMNSAGQYKKAA